MDIDAHGMKCVRSCIDKYLTEYNISIATFDNYDMPIKDCSLDYVTSLKGLSCSCMNPADDPKSNPYQYSADKEKVIDEIYRILKPGGCFVGLEMNMEFKYDLQRIYDYCNQNGKLFGIYTYDEIQAALAFLIEEPWRDKFISAGFQVELEKKYYPNSGNRYKNILRGITSGQKIREWTDEEEILNEMPYGAIEHIKSKRTIDEMLKDDGLIEYINGSMRGLTMIKNGWRRKLTTDEITDILRIITESDLIQKHINENRYKDEDIGIDFYTVDILYILRKPN